ncbi:MAG: glucose-6-phosphate isomerase [Candidatus Nanopelagicales bacterium]|nr:glucose-6-phosphate isomerase [Candidatus Nanopelagicales bacterium]
MVKSLAWDELNTLADSVGGCRIRELLQADPGRAERFVAEGAGLTLDYSRQRLDDDVLAALLKLAEERGVEARRDSMFSGARINVTEDRAVLHTALRLPRDASLVVDGVDVVAGVHDVLDRMSAFADRVRSGEWVGHTGKRIRNIVNIGIGGSDLGPVMAYLALRAYSDRDLCFRFVSNVDGTDVVEATMDLDPAETLFIISSKTFTTLETMSNAAAAREWVIAGLGQEADVAKHFVAVSTNADAVAGFGIDTANMFGFWEWVGGRYSMDSAIGLSTMIAVGPAGFQEMLAGFHAMDEHFRIAPARGNLPMLMGLISVWNRNFLDCPTVAVLPYEQYLSRFPAYLQQLTMESNGKRVRLDGSPVQSQTGPIYWGEPGTNGQHSFYQLIHQGTSVIPVDVLFFDEPLNDVGRQHDLLVANALAQAAVFALGRTEEEVRADGAPDHLVAHKVMPGNRPCSVITAKKLTPHSLGALVALYEHIVFVAGAIWGVDSFDQWGVELGKVLASQLVPQLIDGAGAPAEQDPATTAAVARYRSARDRG